MVQHCVELDKTKSSEEHVGLKMLFSEATRNGLEKKKKLNLKHRVLDSHSKVNRFRVDSKPNRFFTKAGFKN